MADITKSVSLSSESKKLISSKFLLGFDYSKWADKDLAPVRKEIRDFYRTQQNNTCCYCKQKLSTISASNCHVEHIAPKSLYPDYLFTPQNLCVVCADCNEVKRSQETLGAIPDTLDRNTRKSYPKISNAFKIVHPHFDDYDQHIKIINGFYIDRDSAKGNFTIGACRLNRKFSQLGYEPEYVNETELSSEMIDFVNSKDSIRKFACLERIKKILFF